jgi:hypothetical protein
MYNEIFLQTFFPFSKTQDTDYEAKIFIEAGRNAMKTAETEVEFGDEAGEALVQENSSTLNMIAHWHYQNSLQQFEKAIVNFEQARRLAISKNYQKYVELKLKKCLEKTTFIQTNKLNSRQMALSF